MTGTGRTGRWRVGGHWNVDMTTVVEEGWGEPDADGRRPGDRLVGVAGDLQTAARIVAAVNDQRAARVWCADELRAFAQNLPVTGQELTPLGIAAALSAIANAWRSGAAPPLDQV